MRGDQVITLGEVCELTGLSNKRILALLREAGLERIGRNYFRSEVKAFFKCRSDVLNMPKYSFINTGERWRYINRKWRSYINDL